MKRQAYLVPKAGSLSSLKIVTESMREPDAGEVLIEVAAVGLNFADIFAVQGLYSATPEGAFTPGLEYSGTILGVGEGVSDLREGQRVMGVTRFGGYATHIVIDRDYVVPIPDGWSFNEGAAYLVQGLTAYYGLFPLGDMKPGKTVLVHSAAGGVGINACRMALRAGGYVIGTVSSAEKIETLVSEGCQGTIVRARNFREQLGQALDGRPLDIVMECIGGRVLRAGYDLLAPQGRMVVYGSSHYTSPGSRPNWLRLLWLYMQRPKIDAQKMIESNKGMLGFNLIWLYEKKELMISSLAAMKTMQLPPPVVGEVFPFEELPSALRLFQRGVTVGKVVVAVR